MQMTEQEFRNEMIYSITMWRVKIMLERGLITMDEYRLINEKMKAKYQICEERPETERGKEAVT